MTPEQFCYWLQGLLECKSEGDFLTLAETRSVRDHLATVFEKRTPDRREKLRERQITEAIHQTRRIC
jgi:hypothetical protein